MTRKKQSSLTYKLITSNTNMTYFDDKPGGHGGNPTLDVQHGEYCFQCGVSQKDVSFVSYAEKEPIITREECLNCGYIWSKNSGQSISKRLKYYHEKNLQRRDSGEDTIPEDV